MLEPPHASDTQDIAGWATSADEARWWGGDAVLWPVDPSIFSTWHADPDVRPYVLREDGVPLAYGEVWVDDDEQEVELGRIIVRPERRRHGLGRRMVSMLMDQAMQTGYLSAFLRVAPEDAAALACYRAAGFVPVPADEQREFNQGQPIEYVWLRRAMGASTPFHSASSVPAGF